MRQLKYAKQLTNPTLLAIHLVLPFMLAQSEFLVQDIQTLFVQIGFFVTEEQSVFVLP